MKKDSLGYKLFHPGASLKGWMMKPFWQSMETSLGLVSSSGINVSHTNALSSAAYYAGVSFRARTLAQIPFITYKRLTRGKERAIDHQLYSLLHDSPNSEMTAYDFIEALEGHRWTWGNAYAEIEWEPRDVVPLALWPLRPDRMIVSRDDQTRELQYRYSLPNGDVAILKPNQVLHIPGLSFDGTVGYDPITLHRETIGDAKAVQKFGATFFRNGASLNGVLTHPEELTDNARKNMRKSFEEIYGGLNKAHRVAILEEGVTYQSIGVPPDNAQFLETRKFSVTEMARILNLPPHIIFDLSNATFSNIEQQSLELVIYHLMPDFVRWEQRAKLRLLPGLSNREYFAKFLIAGLLRGDTAARNQAYSVGRQWGWLSANDVRELEDMNAIEGGDIYLVPLNMTPTDQLSSLDGPIPSNDDSNNDTDVDEDQPQSGIKERKVSSHPRHRLARQYQKAFAKAAAKLISVESREILKAFNSGASFAEWMDEYYKVFPSVSRAIMGGIFESFAREIEKAARSEVSTMDVVTEEKVAAFVEAYNEAFAKRHISSSRGQLTELMSSDDAALAIDERMGEWGERRAGKIAANESVQLSNGVAVTVFAAAGVQKLQWQNTGSKTCPFCQKLNGKIVGIDKPFLNAGDNLTAGASAMIIRGPKMQPPIHLGCSCIIVPA